MMIPPNKRPTPDTFHRERSKCVDAFADVEQAVILILRICGAKVGGEPFGAKIQKLRDVAPSPKISRAAVAKMPEVIERCAEIANLRNDIVHSKLKIAILDDEHKACFVNLREDDKSSQTARIMSLAGLREVAGQMTALANDLRLLIANPPSSPPPPSPGAAGDP